MDLPSNSIARAPQGAEKSPMDMDSFGRHATAIALAGLYAFAPSGHAQSQSGATRPDEVVATGRRPDSDSEPTPSAAKLLAVPGTFGDPLKAIAALPGVVQPSEGSGEPAVRGSAPEDNAFLVDGLPVAFVFHDFGNSIFNEDVVRDFGFSAAGFGARYGQASGALFDIVLRAPRPEPRATTVDVSMLRAGALVETRITDKQAVYVSFRESLLHLLLDSAYDDEDRVEDDIAIDRYPRARDMQAKYTWRAGEHHTLSLLAIGAYDEAGVTLGAGSEAALLDPGRRGAAATATAFTSGGATWQYTNGDLAVTTRVGRLSRSDDQARGNGSEFIDLDLDQWTAKSEARFTLSSAQRVTVGLERREQTYDYAAQLRYRSCTAFSPDCGTTLGELTESTSRETIGSTEAFVEDAWRPGENFDVVAGVRYSRDDYTRAEFWEPRLAAAWRYDERWQFHAALGRYHQLPSIEQLLPVFGNPDLMPFEADHYVLGFTRKLGSEWSVATELYYKDLSGLVVDVEGPTRYVNAATGAARGVELMVTRERAGRWGGWATLSLARSERRNGLNGQSAVFDTDTPVIANVVLRYELTPKWTAGMRWQYRSGLPYTPIVGNEENPAYPGFYRPVYGELNSARAGAYHRLDLRFERPVRLAGAAGIFYIDVVNAYGRTNGGAVGYEPIAGSAEYRLVENDGLPFLPSVGVKVTF
jgi:hypothetical protein